MNDKDIPSTPLADESKGHDLPSYLPAAALAHIPEAKGLNVSTMIKGQVAAPLNLFEKKAALINA